MIVDDPQEGEAPGVVLEYPAGTAWGDNTEEVKRFTTIFDEVTKLAMSSAKSTDLIAKRRKVLESL
ncbi:hypothetical protein [Actinokineospora fastidiosa]|uniref:DUF5753 domain-containing protein n=1 Tax=Actinokineospora fastidiosa TaxID=1816 RepID=A0A918GN95_9PSEU|nr:hypothetical protein [Actinokineospora fastidiosa]GGS47041.1 hypothetical protein GCM10010171_47820 [Actinokineospora fastidiosa]